MVLDDKSDNGNNNANDKEDGGGEKRGGGGGNDDEVHNFFNDMNMDFRSQRQFMDIVQKEVKKVIIDMDMDSKEKTKNGNGHENRNIHIVSPVEAKDNANNKVKESVGSGGAIHMKEEHEHDVLHVNVIMEIHQRIDEVMQESADMKEKLASVIEQVEQLKGTNNNNNNHHNNSLRNNSISIGSRALVVSQADLNYRGSNNYSSYSYNSSYNSNYTRNYDNNSSYNTNSTYYTSSYNNNNNNNNNTNDEENIGEETTTMQQQQKQKEHKKQRSVHLEPYDQVESGLSTDTYTLMMTKSTFTKSWWFGFIIFVVQVVLLSIIFHIQHRSSNDSTPFDIPFKVDLDVRISQFLAILISIMISHDIFMPIKDLTILWISNPEWSKVVSGISDHNYRSLRNSLEQNDHHDDIFDGRPSDRFFCWLVQIFLPSLLKFVQGVLVLVITFVIVIQADDTIELFKDFAAMQVISELDDVAFHLSSHGYFGAKLKKDANESKKITVMDRTIMFLGMPLRPLVLSVLFITMISIFVSGVVVSQENMSFFKLKYPHCGINHEKIANINNGFCNGGTVNSFECGFDGGGEYFSLIKMSRYLYLILISLSGF